MSHMALRRSITAPIIAGGVSVALAIAMLVGWILVIVWRSESLGVLETWLLVLGIVSLTIIGGVLVTFIVILVSVILESRRQVTFIDSVTHELRSPLASLKLCAETLGRPGISDPQRERLREMMLGDVDRLSGFIEDVLVSNRLAHEAEVRDLAALELEPLLRRCAGRVARRHEVDEETVRIVVAGPLRLRTDSTALETVVQNLLDNAVKYSDPPPQVEVRASREGDDVRIEVVDEGIGLSPKDRKRIFDRFYRVDSEDVRRRRGTGLGLFVVQSLVRELGGRIAVSSPGHGQGTTVTVTLSGAAV